jgi:threonine dehydrogenase-like Zn-dependent dehydrogenase
MIAAVVTKPRLIELQKVTAPSISDNQVKVRLEGCGICASSLPFWEGRDWFSYPSEPGSPGHEGWGIVEAVGERVTNISAGDRVAFLSSHAFAEYDVAEENSLVKIPQALSGKPFPGEPLGCAMNIFERSNIQPGDTVAIIGSGFLGGLLCQLCMYTGAKVIAISKRQYSLEQAKRYGADELIPLTSTWDVTNKVSEITNGTFCQRVIEATGKQEGVDVATEIVAEGARMIIAGFHQDGLRQVNLQKWNWKGIDVINAHERDPKRYLSGMEKAVDAVTSGMINPDALYTHLISLQELNRGFELTANRPDGFMKALVQLNN